MATARKTDETKADETKAAEATKAEETKATPKDDKAQADSTPAGVTERSDTQHEEVPSTPQQKDTEDDLAAENEEEFEEVGYVEEVENALGTTSERDLDGNEYDVPWLYLTAAEVEATPARTSDWDDNGRSWTAQEVSADRHDENDEAVGPVALVEVEATPGQVFRVRELPNRAVAEAAGIDFAQFVTGLPVRPDVPGEAPRRGTPA